MNKIKHLILTILLYVFVIVAYFIERFINSEAVMLICIYMGAWFALVVVYIYYIVRYKETNIKILSIISVTISSYFLFRLLLITRLTYEINNGLFHAL